MKQVKMVANGEDRVGHGGARQRIPVTGNSTHASHDQRQSISREASEMYKRHWDQRLRRVMKLSTRGTDDCDAAETM